MRFSGFSRSGVLVIGPNSIQSLVPLNLVSQVESLLEVHKIPEAIALADQHRKKLRQKPFVEEDEADELRYVYQRIGLQCLSETRFEEAGDSLFDGELDPRILVGFFPELQGSLFNPDDSIELFTGIVKSMPTETSIEDIIVMNLVRNYSPYLSPNTRSAPPTTELRKIYLANAKDMLEKFLRKWRSKRRSTRASGSTSSKEKEKVTGVDIVIDTVLAKLFAFAEKTADLYTLLQESNDADIAELEPVLKLTGQYNALCILYKQSGDHDKLLEVWSKIADGEWTDDDILDPISDMITLLNGKRDKLLTQKWGIWLAKKDPEKGLKLLKTKESGKRRDKQNDDLALLQELRDASPAAGAQYLEHLVLEKRSTSRELHNQLAASCIDQLITCLNDASISKLWRAKASSYASSPNSSPFIQYFASTTPDSDSKRTRLKTALFLQGSSLYDLAQARERLAQHAIYIPLELAIIDGKLGDHTAAISTLVHTIHDTTSAETYCTLEGNIISVKTANYIGETCGLQQWCSLFLPPKSANAKQADVKGSPEHFTSRRVLFKVLLQVYIDQGESSIDRVTRLLDSQAVNLDTADVITSIPSSWPLSAMSSFLARSLRRTLHGRHEGQLIKNIASAQNYRVAEQTWLVLREQGAIVEEAVEGEDDDDAGDLAEYSEKSVLDLSEKSGFNESMEILVNNVRDGALSQLVEVPSSIQILDIALRLTCCEPEGLNNIV